MNPEQKQQLVALLLDDERADGVALVIFHSGMKAAEFVSASMPEFAMVLPDKLEQIARNAREQFKALDQQVN